MSDCHTRRRDRESAKYKTMHLDLARDVALSKVLTKRQIHTQHRKDWLAGLN